MKNLVTTSATVLPALLLLIHLTSGQKLPSGFEPSNWHSPKQKNPFSVSEHTRQVTPFPRG